MKPHAYSWQSTNRRSRNQIYANNHYIARLAIGVLVGLRVVDRLVVDPIRDLDKPLSGQHHQWINYSVAQPLSIVGTLDSSRWVSRMATFPYSISPTTILEVFHGCACKVVSLSHTIVWN